jgi:ribonuclease HI
MGTTTSGIPSLNFIGDEKRGAGDLDFLEENILSQKEGVKRKSNGKHLKSPSALHSSHSSPSDYINLDSTDEDLMSWSSLRSRNLSMTYQLSSQPYEPIVSDVQDCSNEHLILNGLDINAREFDPLFFSFSKVIQDGIDLRQKAISSDWPLAVVPELICSERDQVLYVKCLTQAQISNAAQMIMKLIVAGDLSMALQYTLDVYALSTRTATEINNERTDLRFPGTKDVLDNNLGEVLRPQASKLLNSIKTSSSTGKFFRSGEGATSLLPPHHGQDIIRKGIHPRPSRKDPSSQEPILPQYLKTAPYPRFQNRVSSKIQIVPTVGKDPRREHQTNMLRRVGTKIIIPIRRMPSNIGEEEVRTSIIERRNRKYYKNRGKTKLFAKHWEETCGGRSFVEIGVIPLWKQEEKLNLEKRKFMKEIKQGEKEKQAFRELLLEELDQRIVVPISWRKVKWLNPSFVVPKPHSNKFRKILDCRELNNCLNSVYFKMENTQVVADILIQQDWGTSIDLTSAFNHLIVNPCFRPYLAFQFEGKLYTYRAMPFGLSLSPYLFTKMMRFPICFIRRNWQVRTVIYMDDILLLHQSQQYLSLATREIVNYLTYLGLTVNMEKSELIPKQELIFLGWLWDLRRASVAMTEEKRQEMLHSCLQWERICSNRKLVKIKELASFIGSLSFLRLQFSRASLYLSSLYKALNLSLKISNQNWKGITKLSRRNRSEISWWIRNIATNVPNLLLKCPQPEVVLITDASRAGWGAVLVLQEQEFFTWGQFKVQISEQSSNYREITAVLLALRFFRPLLIKKEIKCISIQSDNQVSVAILNKIKARNKLLLPTRKIFSTLAKMKIQLVAQYIPGILNVSADSLSRLELAGDYRLDPAVFRNGLEIIQECPNIDLFSSDENHLLPQYVTAIESKKAIAVDAFSLDWKLFFPYIHPPIILIASCLKRVVQSQGRAIIVTPHWPGQPWWPLLQQLSQKVVQLGESSKVLIPGTLMKRRNLKLPPGKMIMSLVSSKPFSL